MAAGLETDREYGERPDSWLLNDWSECTLVGEALPTQPEGVLLIDERRG